MLSHLDLVLSLRQRDIGSALVFFSFFSIAKEVSTGDAGGEDSSGGIKGTKIKEHYWLPD